MVRATGRGEMVEEGHSTFLSFRLMGSGLDPDRATAAMGTRPDVAHRKGDEWRTRTTGRPARRLATVWIARSPEVLGRDHAAHVAWMTGFLGRHAGAVRSLLAAGGVEMDVSSFWHGARGQAEPDGDGQLAWLVGHLGGTYERDHSTDEAAGAA